MGIFRTVFTKMEQFACARGYSNSFSGIAITLCLVVGFFGSLVVGAVVNKTSKLEEAVNICGGLSCISGIIFTQLLRKPNMDAWILTSMSL